MLSLEDMAELGLQFRDRVLESKLVVGYKSKTILETGVLQKRRLRSEMGIRERLRLGKGIREQTVEHPRKGSRASIWCKDQIE